MGWAMAELSDPQLADFCNTALRPLADKLQTLITQAPLAVAIYNARNLGTVLDKGGAGNLVEDGSAVDGRTRRSGGDIYNFVTLLMDLDAFMTQGRKDVIAGWQVNGLRG